MAKAVALALAASACGRIGFAGGAGTDAAHDATIDAPTNDAPPISGLVGWWKLDEASGTIAHDSTGMSEGVLMGAGWSWTPAGKFGSAISFVGDGSDVRFGAPVALNNLPAVTVSAWIQPTSVTFDGSPHCMVDKGDSSAPVGGWFVGVAQQQDGDVSFGSFFALGGDQAVRISVADVVHAGTWSHLVATWDGTHDGTGIHLYIDGAEVMYQATQSATETVRPDDSAIGAAIGCLNSSSFAGVEDDVKLFDRVLSPAELGQI